jgi:hypothetical protein
MLITIGGVERALADSVIRIGVNVYAIGGHTSAGLTLPV